MMRKSFLFSALLNIPLCLLPLYACNGQDDMVVELISKKRKASTELSLQENEPSFQEKNLKKIKNNNNNDNQLTPSMIFEENPLMFMELSSFPEEVKANIVKFLSVKERNKAALVSHSFYKAARTIQMTNDIRALKDKKWQGSPELNSFNAYLENYLLNSIIWKMGHTLLNHPYANEENRRIFITGAAHLGRYFGHIKYLDDILEGFSNPDEYTSSNKSTALREYSKNNPKSGEDDLLSLIIYIATDGQFYKLPDNLPVHLNLIERTKSTQLSRHTLYKDDITLEERIHAWYRLNRDTLTPITKFSYVQEIDRLCSLGSNETDPEKKLSCFLRASQLLDILFSERDEDAQILENNTYSQLTETRLGMVCHFLIGQNTTVSEQKMASYLRAAQFSEFILQTTAQKPLLRDVDNAAYTHFKAWKNLQDPTQKLIYAQRTLDIYENLLPQANKPEDIRDLKRSARVSLYLAEHSTDPIQKLRYHLKATQLYDSFLLKTKDNLSIKKIKEAAQAYLSLAQNTPNSTHKTAAYMRAAELQDLYLSKNKKASTQDIKEAAQAYLYLAQNTPNPAQEKEAYERATKLYDSLFQKTVNNTDLKSVQNAAYTNYLLAQREDSFRQKKRYYKKASNLYDALLSQTNQHNDLQDLRNAAYAHLYVANHTTREKMQQELLTKAANLYDSVLLKTGAETTVEDLKNAASAHYFLGKNETNSAQKLASHIRSADLFEALFTKMSSKMSYDERQHAITANRYIKENTVDLEVKIKAMERIKILEFRDAVFF